MYRRRSSTAGDWLCLLKRGLAPVPPVDRARHGQHDCPDASAHGDTFTNCFCPRSARVSRSNPSFDSRRPRPRLLDALSFGTRAINPVLPFVLASTQRRRLTRRAVNIIIVRDRFHRDRDPRSKTSFDSRPENGCTSLEKHRSRLRTAAFRSMQASSGDCRFFRQSAAPGLSLPPLSRQRESRLQPRICAITAPLPPPMLYCASAYGYRFPVASSFQSGHRDKTLPPSFAYRFHGPIRTGNIQGKRFFRLFSMNNGRCCYGRWARCKGGESDFTFCAFVGLCRFFPFFFVFAGTLFLRFVEIPGRFEVGVEILCRGLNDL